ncbi:hypothetical protein M409DRAFT_19491 [Zasmidium cellare ATCC 36951]|uniref:Mediator of RNA polymerase II transcription subunit 14 n=1 Tax=Zasmidium cellare ATCC 36951 TaxID=1080233 RepID=A0A6A6CUG0_ZASCE|nr:uncharacterized protein M409DRAFT_19491 [Zasmidium cellare ATCC 36951]KAF2170675.1 hypothetical protein M409DRAFT_19491 [Zasmidium cellare ATCC 36951]
MDQQGANGSHDLKKEHAQAQAAGLPPKPDFTQKQMAPPVSAPDNHAVNGSLPNGAPGQGPHPPATNGDIAVGTAVIADPQSPPELDQSWREQPNNKSMGTLIDRLAQACFEDLNSTLQKMADTPVEPRSGQPNGITQPSTDSSEASLSKKRTFMDFANGQRDRFIKTLVLSDWARSSDEMSRLVDIKVMFDQRDAMQKFAINFIGHVKRDVNQIKIPNPNIDLAMELLAAGKASKLPHLGYIAPKRLSAKETLKALRNMNVALETRLNLHEDLPPLFNDFSVANGKATFRVPGEFEVDLAIADEDINSQFYFINARFLFSPAAADIPGPLLKQLEDRSNLALATKGLQGCYELLHNFILTYKINVLYDQARQVEREKWFGCLGIQKSHRVLTVQYWRGMPGRKSWIEIAVSSGKQQSRRSRRPTTPQLSVRWFRRGELVEDHGLEFDWQNLSLEHILRNVVARHISWVLRATQGRLQVLAGANSKLQMALQSSKDSAEDSHLTLSLPGMQSTLAVRLEPITGHVSMSTTTPRAADLEGRLNKQPDPDLALALAGLLCNTVKDRVDKAAELAAWSPYRAVIRTDNFKAIFGADVTSWRAFVPSPGWASQTRQWVLFPTFSLAGQKWWVVRLENKSNSSQNPSAKAIVIARRVTVDRIVAPNTASIMSRSLLLQIEKLAVAEVSFAVLSEQLSSEKIPHRVQRIASLTDGDSSAGSMPMSAMLIQWQALPKSPSRRDSAVDPVKVTNQGFMTQGVGSDGTGADIGHELRLTVDDGKLKSLRAYLADSRRPSDIAMNASGGLAIRLRTSFGEPFFEQIKDLLRSCERLDMYLQMLDALKMRPVVASTTKFSFIYNDAPELSTTITFRGSDDKLSATLKLEPSAINPQQRQRLAFEKLMNSTTTPNRFAILCQALRYSLPIMQLWEKLESADSTGPDFTVTVLDANTMKLAYKAPLPTWVFYIELRINKKTDGGSLCIWKIRRDKSTTPRELGSTVFGRALLDLAKHKDNDWLGLEDGTLVGQTVPGGALALESLDRLMRSFRGVEDSATKQEDAPQQQQRAPPQQKPAPTNSKPAPAKTNSNPNAARNNQSKVKKEVIELD